MLALRNVDSCATREPDATAALSTDDMILAAAHQQK
jgi:hypothetical protein